MAIKDVYASDGSVLRVMTVPQSFSLGKRSLVELSDLHRLRKCLADHFEKHIGRGQTQNCLYFDRREHQAVTCFSFRGCLF
jgi:ribosomal protein S3AE